MAPAETEARKPPCPAFADGCPYAGSSELLEWLRSRRRPEAESGLCPAFDTGCPFREIKDLEALKYELQKLPPSHAGQPVSSLRTAETAGGAKSRAEEAEGPPTEKESAAHAAIVEMLQAIHRRSQSVKEVVGGDCPVFQQECPFKTCVTSSGMPLALALEIRSWDFLIESEELVGAQAEAQAAAMESVAGDDDEDSGLAKKLKLGTQDAHKAAESVHFVREFIKGKVPGEVYGQMLVNLYFVYSAMEEALDKCADHPHIDPIHFPDELNRTEALAKDAEFFLGPKWRDTPATAVAKEYVERLRGVAATAPELLVPHAYTRYLGDLSGGQVLKKAAVRGMKLPADGSGVEFYTFRRIRDRNTFKNMYRARLDTLGVDTCDADRMVTEANTAFDLNTRMFQELDAAMGFSPPPAVAAAVASTAGPTPSVAGAAPRGASRPAAAACPFAALAAQGVPMPEGHPEFDAHERKATGAAPAAAAAAPRGAMAARFSQLGLRGLAPVALAPVALAGLVALLAWAYALHAAAGTAPA